MTGYYSKGICVFVFIILIGGYFKFIYYGLVRIRSRSTPGSDMAKMGALKTYPGTRAVKSEGSWEITMFGRNENGFISS